VETLSLKLHALIQNQTVAGKHVLKNIKLGEGKLKKKGARPPVFQRKPQSSFHKGSSK